ncbi:MAG: acetyl/propionyl/methylcrotonyl-CoA carboxylase subunit alpha [Betaproteobacteria bacterium]|nr:acetyl/propionyl/methylcrotonyl-CoA carboxylase subunit alpha [Betaproteobacteria bacterium]MDH5222309.1 acetyl/propionyl/methylcrotonyl-CoA carboxylase subunit alpha [Betaproteobacteria bacterium]MDH5351433.1 acetyl/propionyl/methylcrotonyl-CoA carboxylase subunit alpha [Betaproteobacteria bacterium]
MFRRILIANRGEIACRVMRTARRMGVRTVAVYSDADRDARHVRLADEARRIGPPPARESYLDIEAILAAARDTGAEAIHPGYGFLAENEDFARACAKAGLVFIGPAPEAIAAMGDKSAAKRLMERARVPLVPGYHGEQQDAAQLAKEAGRIGYPVLIKASAGGGGKGMRIVRAAPEFKAALEGAQREAQSAFGDARVLVEKYLERPRHIEVQVFGDTHGNLVYLFERDCSVQRRHQKVLEEAPAPGMSEKRRKEMGEAAVAAARAVGYTGAGTVEFIAEQDGRFYFMEMNTRLQVEHPVTEMITGLDLVEWQLRVAAGEKLPRAQEHLAIRGHAVEARLYAEDPAREFLPQTGRLAHLRFPEDAPDLRTDAGVDAGAAITPHYDPMIAKLIAWGADRRAALARLASALDEVEIAGLRTNVEFLARTLRCRDFAEGELDTGLIERNRAALLPARPPLSEEMLATAACAELFAEEDAARQRAAASGDPHSPWNRVDGWRLNQDSHHAFGFAEGEDRHPVTVHFGEAGWRMDVAGRNHALEAERLADGRLLVRLDGRAWKARAVRDGRDWHVFLGGAHRRLTLHDELEGLDIDAGGGSLAAPMPGKVIAVMVKRGDKVQKGAPLLILEAMKMEHTIFAPGDGEVKEIHYAAGEQVAEGAELLRLE